MSNLQKKRKNMNNITLNADVVMLCSRLNVRFNNVVLS